MGKIIQAQLETQEMMLAILRKMEGSTYSFSEKYTESRTTSNELVAEEECTVLKDNQRNELITGY